MEEAKPVVINANTTAGSTLRAVVFTSVATVVTSAAETYLGTDVDAILGAPKGTAVVAVSTAFAALWRKFFGATA